MTSRPLAFTSDTLEARQAAFLRLVSERLDSSYRTAHGLLGDLGAAEDATHDAIVRAWSAFPRLRDRTAFDAWFRRILVNTCRDIQRDRRDRPTVPLDAALPMVGRDQDPAVLWAERDALVRAIGVLRPEHREVVVLCYLADLPLAEVATTLGVPLGTVKSRLHHALSYLRAEVDAAARTRMEANR